jgi:hypothetical protein
VQIDAKEENIIEAEVQPSMEKTSDNRNTTKGNGD